MEKYLVMNGRWRDDSCDGGGVDQEWKVTLGTRECEGRLRRSDHLKKGDKEEAREDLSLELTSDKGGCEGVQQTEGAAPKQVAQHKQAAQQPDREWLRSGG